MQQPIKYEYMVETIAVPWEPGAPWPYMPAQEIILAEMNRIGKDGWVVIEHISGPTPTDVAIPRLVNLWAHRVVLPRTTPVAPQKIG